MQLGGPSVPPTAWSHRGIPTKPGQSALGTLCPEFCTPPQTAGSKLTWPPFLPGSKTPQSNHLGVSGGGMVRPSFSISPNVKMKSKRKQLAGVCPAYSVGVPADMSEASLSISQGGPFTPHYPAKNSRAASLALYLH